MSDRKGGSAGTYLLIDAVLVCCLVAFTVAPGVGEMLKSLPEQVAFVIYLALLLASDFFWLKAAFSMRQIQSRRVFCFLVFALLTLVNFVATLEVVLGIVVGSFHLS